MSEDIIERLRDAPYLNDKKMVEAIIADAIAEIEFLRLHAGAVTRGESFDDISRRVGLQPKRED